MSDSSFLELYFMFILIIILVRLHVAQRVYPIRVVSGHQVGKRTEVKRAQNKDVI